MSRVMWVRVVVVTGAIGCVAPAMAQPAVGDATERALREVVAAAAPGTVAVDAAGLTGSGRRIWAVEPVPTGAPQPTLVLVGGLDGNAEGSATVIRVLRWWFSDSEAAPLRGAWRIAAISCARPDRCDGAAPEATTDALVFPPTGGFFDGASEPTAHYLWRWVTMQAPTVVVEVRDGRPWQWAANASARALADDPGPVGDQSLAGALGAGAAGAAWSPAVPALQLTARGDSAVQAIRDLARRSIGAVSPLRVALAGRTSRRPLEVARLLATRYPAQPIMSYIPALAWSGALRLSRLTGEARFHDKAVAAMTPFLTGTSPAIAEPYLLTSLAGHLAFADLAALEGSTAADGLTRTAADFILPQDAASREIVRFRRAWTDDMFMATSVLARAWARTKDDRYQRAAGQLLTSYAGELQRPDGLFVHAKEGPFAWGRGNGFAAFGLMDALTYLPPAWPERPRVLQSLQALMKGLVARQAPDGMWRQVVDEPGSYREFTVTAMVVTAMARGIRLGWIDAATYRPVVDRAWRGLLARIGEDGSLMDVCTGTGSGPTRAYYLNRAGLTGADDRGGAMGLTAAIEVHQLTTP